MLELALLLVLIVDPFGAMATLTPMLRRFEPARQRRILARESVIATVVLLLASWAGGFLLEMLGLSQHSLRLTGGIILFLIALEMVFPGRKRPDSEDQIEDEPLIVPIAVPFIAGPSALAMVILSVHEHGHTLVAGSVLLAMLVSAAILIASPTLFAKLGKRGTIAIERLMGMLLIVIAVQMFLDGLDSYLTHL